MVNEINKPPTDTIENENAALGERLLASNRNLQDMQAEHRQLMQEMESLRLRATELTQLTAQQQTVPEPEPESEREPNNNTTTIVNQDEANVANTTTPEASPTEESAAADDAEDDAASAEYIRAKFAEIAALKAQYARVQHMINTTNLIEQHIAAKEKASETNTTQAAKVNASHPADSLSTIGTAPTPAAANLPVDGSNSSTGDAGTDSTAANEELLSTMLNMFTDFTSELRSEADSLRAERDRLRALKEEIMRHRQRPS